jgi:hypothetical protein
VSLAGDALQYHGDVAKVWAGGCATVRLTSVLGDTVQDKM